MLGRKTLFESKTLQYVNGMIKTCFHAASASRKKMTTIYPSLNVIVGSKVMFFIRVYYFVHISSLILGEGCGGEHRGRYTREVKDYEVVVPKKISENGDFISYYLPHYYNIARVRRGADTGKVHYVIPINGQERILELMPSEEFHAPGMVIEHHEHDAKNNVNTVKLRRPRKANCYYYGKIRDDELSSAAITACSGLAGSIKMGREQYLIEPVEDDGTPTEGPKHRHLLYKSEYKRDLSNQTSCGTSGDFRTAFKQRMEWEEKYGQQIEAAMTEKNEINEDEMLSVESNSQRKKRWCTTCKPAQIIKCQTPFPSCYTERPLFIEMLIVVGPRVAEQQYLDEDLEQYVNTIINIAVRHFMDASLRRPVLVKLVRVITLGFLYPDLDAQRYEADDLLQRFCDWQLHFNPKKEGHPNHHDFAMYLVKFGQCKNLMGLTNMAGMCRPDKSCGIVSQEGLLTGHIITHMLGHSLGADHDEKGESGCCPEEPDGTHYHMAKHISARSSAFSVCSKQCIGKFADTHAAWCMTDLPTSVDMTEPTLLPGQVYTAAEQCRINFEIDTYACLVGEFCKRLYCKVSEKECASTGEPPAQGTRCGPDQWCFNGRCVHRGSRPGAINGEWGIWSPWSPCTKTCGGGIQTSQRACDSPAPSLSGRLCPGAWIKSRMCNVGACVDGGKGFLDQQCKNTNVRPYHGRKHEWQYFNQQIEDLKCVVMCINEKNEVAVRFPIAVDGTYCNPGTKDVCIRGVCTRVGCDWVIGSKAKEDACGICHGNGTECRIMQGFFTESNFKGKMPFLKLPIGTSMILIRETRPSLCYFIISNSLNSTNYLNSDNVDDQTYANGGVFKMKSTVGIYQLKANMERIFIRDQLSVPITVSTMCIEEEPNVGILYQYALPEPISTTAKYTWEYLSWEKCPTSCGGAIQRSIPVCVEAQGGEVEDSYCSPQMRPPDKIRVCNSRPCDAKWWVGPWVECECYQNNGITTRMVMCAHMKEAKSSYISLVAEEECVGVPKPHAIKPCDPEKNQELWLKKGFTRKRDVTDIIPYSEANEDYSVWDDVPEDSYPYMTNVRHMFQSMDPENVEDYIYLKQIGMTSDIWDRIHNHAPQRIRRRRRTPILANPSTNSHEAIYRTTDGRRVHIDNVVNEHTTLRPLSQPVVTTTKKKNPGELEIKPTKTYMVKVRKETTSVGKSWERQIIFSTQAHHVLPIILSHRNTSAAKLTTKAIHTTTEAQSSKALTIKVHHKTTEAPLKGPGQGTTERLKEMTKAHHKITVEVTTKGMSKAEQHRATHESALKGATTKIMYHKTTQMVSLKQATTKTVNFVATGKNKEQTENTVLPHPKTVETRKMTAVAVTAVDRRQTKKSGVTRAVSEGAEKEPVAKHDITTNQPTTLNPTALSVQIIEDEPGLTAYSMYASETPAPQDRCWKKEMKPQKEEVPCRPKEENVAEPADEAPELDFFNTSKVKIFVVPIKTTIRTIIQNDQEFVIMETLAKYPVADELNVIEHWGDDAKKQIRLAKDRATRTTHDPLVQD